MHATLFLGTDKQNINKAIKKHSSNSKLHEFELQKIDDVRELAKQLKLASNQARIYLFRDIDQATVEAMNAFLKILEEPKKHVSYILTAKNSGKILPTILSRVNVIRTTPSKINAQDTTNDLLNRTLTQRLEKIDSIKKREQASKFLESLIQNLHSSLLDQKNDQDITKIKQVIEQAISSKIAIDNNGNVNLHLSKFMILIDSR